MTRGPEYAGVWAGTSYIDCRSFKVVSTSSCSAAHLSRSEPSSSTGRHELLTVSKGFRITQVVGYEATASDCRGVTSGQ